MTEEEKEAIILLQYRRTGFKTIESVDYVMAQPGIKLSSDDVSLKRIVKDALRNVGYFLDALDKAEARIGQKRAVLRAVKEEGDLK